MSPLASLDALLQGEVAALRSRALRVRVARALALGLAASTLVLLALAQVPAWRAGALVGWLAIVAAVMTGWWWTRGLWVDESLVASGVEADLKLRRGEVRVVREAALAGPLGAHAAARLTQRLVSLPAPRAQTLTTQLQRSERMALGGAAMALSVFTLAGWQLPASVAWLASPLRVPAAIVDGRPPVVASAPGALLVSDLAARVTYPAYLGRAAEPVALAGTLIVPRGAVIEVTATAPTAAVLALRSSTGAVVPFARDGGAVRASLTASTSGRWGWTEHGAPDVPGLPAGFALDVRPDSAPSVDLGSTSDTLLTAGASVDLDVLAQDDHALSSVVLVVMAGTREVARRELLAGQAATMDVRTTLSLDALGDAAALRVQAVAVDNSPWRQTGRSRVLVLRRAGVEARREQARATADSVAAGASALARQQRELAQQTSEAARTAAQRQRGDSALPFEAREAAEKLTQQQRALQQQAQRLQQQARQLEDQLKSAGALDSALQGRLAEAQQLLQQALSPSLMQKMQQLEQNAARQDAQATRQSLDDLARQQQALREQLERNAEMLRRAALEGSMETLRDEAKELAEAGRRMADSVGRAPSASTRPELDRLAQRSQDLARAARDLQQRLAQSDAQRGAQRTAEAQRQADQAAQRLREAGRNPAEAQQQARTAADQLQQAAEQLGQAREEQVQDWKRDTAGALDQAVQDMMQMAQQQRQLAQQAQQAQARGESSPSAAQSRAREQASLQNGVQQTAQALQEAARASQHVSQGSQRALQEALQKAREATQQAQRAGNSPAGQARSGQATADAMRDAASAMERAASSLVRDRERTNRAQSASGLPEMMEEMQQLARQQQQVNSQAGQMSMMPGGEQGTQGQAMAQALARRQRQIAQRLDDVGGTDRSGRAEALAQEARRLADAMERAASDPETAARREQFFQRLLSAGRTLRREDVDQQQPRESKPGIGMPVYTPRAGVVTGAPATRVAPPGWEELRTLTPEERRAVLQYFEKVGTTPSPRP